MFNVSKAIKMPDGSLLRIEQMARVAPFDHGVGIFDDRGRMLCWIECIDANKREVVSSIFLEVMNSPRRAKQPDWSFLLDDQAVPQAPMQSESQLHAHVPPRRQSATSARVEMPGHEGPSTTSTAGE